MTHIFINLDTLALEANAVILAIHAVKFSPLSNEFEHLDIYPSLEDQLASNRVIDDSTMVWWEMQPSNVIEDVFRDTRTPFNEAINTLNKFCQHVPNIWCKRLSFEIPMLTSAFKTTNTPTPWQLYNLRDTGTLFDYCNYRIKKNAVTIDYAKAIKQIYQNR